jgi:hypothetical protein
VGQLLREAPQWLRDYRKQVRGAVTRLGNGVVQRTVIRALAAVGCAIDVGEAHAAVEALLGHPVSRESITSCLSTGAAADQSRFERVERGRYRLAPDE